MADGQQQDISAQALIPFTGYYTLDPATGSFVMVDTHSVWMAGTGSADPTIDYFGTITLSSDGQTSAQYEVGKDCSFEGNTLTIPGPDGSLIAELSFAEAVGGCSMQGTVEGEPVQGSTPFGPVYLTTWAGTYYRQGEPIEPITPIVYPYFPALRIDSEGNVQFAPDEGALQPVDSYWYDYGMFVVAPIVAGEQHLYEMGTASGWGRVAGNATDGSMLVSIRLNEPAPHL